MNLGKLWEIVGQRILMCCSPWVPKESDLMTEQQQNPSSSPSTTLEMNPRVRYILSLSFLLPSQHRAAENTQVVHLCPAPQSSPNPISQPEKLFYRMKILDQLRMLGHFFFFFLLQSKLALASILARGFCYRKKSLERILLSDPQKS